MCVFFFLFLVFSHSHTWIDTNENEMKWNFPFESSESCVSAWAKRFTCNRPKCYWAFAVFSSVICNATKANQFPIEFWTTFLQHVLSCSGFLPTEFRFTSDVGSFLMQKSGIEMKLKPSTGRIFQQLVMACVEILPSIFSLSQFSLVFFLFFSHFYQFLNGLRCNEGDESIKSTQFKWNHI